MDLLYKNNTIKINNRIASLQNDKKRRENKIKICEEIFTPLSILHMVAAGIYGIAVVVQAMMSNMVIPMYFASPIAIGIISSCAVSLGINGIVKTINEKKKEKLENQIESYMKMLDQYNEKPVKQNFKDITKNMRSKQAQQTVKRVNTYEYMDLYEQPQEEMKMSLRK